MKRVLMVGLVCLVLSALVGCGPTYETTKSGVFDRSYPLWKMDQKMGADGEVSGSFFMFTGGFSGQYTEELQVYFSIEIDGEYKIGKKPITFFSVVFSPDIETPTIRFRRNKDRCGCSNKKGWEQSDDYNIQRDGGVWEHMIGRATGAVITCRPDQWPSRIQLPLE